MPARLAIRLPAGVRAVPAVRSGPVAVARPGRAGPWPLVTRTATPRRHGLPQATLRA